MLDPRLITKSGTQSAGRKWVKQMFTCKLCRQIVNNPVECSGCEVVVCKSCVILFTDDFKCPTETCQEIIDMKKPLSKVIVKLLLGLELTCKECLNPFSYSHYEAHKNKCKNENKIMCPLKCSNKLSFSSPG